MGHSTKSLRSSPLRGGKSREVGSGREDSDSGGGKVNTINQRAVGVQHMIAHGSYPDAAGHIIGRTDDAMTKIALMKAPTSCLNVPSIFWLARN